MQNCGTTWGCVAFIRGRYITWKFVFAGKHQLEDIFLEFDSHEK